MINEEPFVPPSESTTSVGGDFGRVVGFVGFFVVAAGLSVESLSGAGRVTGPIVGFPEAS